MSKIPNLSADPWRWPDLTSDELLSLVSASSKPDGPIGQYVAVRECNALRELVEKGDGFSVLACVRKCGSHGLVMPDWLVYAFNRKYDAVLNCHAMSWDSPLAFGAPYPKGTNLAAVRKRRIGRLRMWSALNEAVNAGKTVDKELYAALGKPYGYGATLVREMCIEAIRLLGLHDPVAERRRLDKGVSGKASSAKSKNVVVLRATKSTPANSSKVASVNKRRR